MMTAVLVFAAVAVAALVITKWLVIAGMIAIWAAWRASRLAHSNPELYGGYRTAVATLTIASVAATVSLGYGVSHIDQMLKDRETRERAATEAAFRHISYLLEIHKAATGSFPSRTQVLAGPSSEPLPTDYWGKDIKYQSYTEAIADGSLRGTSGPARGSGIPFNNFELRSSGPDGKEGTDDDIIMRDGVFLTVSELKKQPVALDSAGR
ncbi:MAG TPA: hypothetical protein VNH22_08570 [Blastocatellia bacterium]|nr:hypothetical protein [Blastocatellia bacterium]